MSTETPDADRSLLQGLQEHLKTEYRESGLYRLRLTSAPVSERIKCYPKPLLVGSEARGRRLLAGEWWLGNQVHRTAPLTADNAVVPWKTLPDAAFSQRLMRFGWLADLMQCGEVGAQVARRLVRAWAEAFRGEFSAHVWSPAQTAARLVAILEAGGAIIEGQSREVRQGLIEVLTWHARHLAAQMEAHPEPDERVAIAAAAAVGALAFESESHKLDACLNSLERALAETITPRSGWHSYRSPSAQFDRLHDLVRLDAMLSLSGIAQRASINVLMAQMARALRFFVAPDRSLLAMNGGRRVTPEHVRAVLRDFSSEEIRNVAIGGFQRQTSPMLHFWVDTEAAPKNNGALTAHAGTLGAEVWAGKHAVFTSCGAHPDLDARWTAALRKTAAHSVLDLVEATSSASFSGEPGFGALSGPEGTNGRVSTQEEGGASHELQHSGWKHTLGLSHRRRLYVSECGMDLRGEDGLFRGMRETIAPPSEPVPFALRFHTHPDVELDPADEGSDCAMLTLKDGSVWEFKANAQIAFAESVFIRPDGRPVATTQLVLAGRADPMGDGTRKPNQILWRLRRVKGPAQTG